MQKFLDKQYNKRFKIVDIDKSYSPDWFHQVTGYELTLEDSNHVQFGNVYIQKSLADKWVLYRGTNIEEEYQKALKTNKKQLWNDMPH
jgi:hypothetical protein